MNLEETIFLSQLTPEQKSKLKFWMPDMARYVLVFPKKIFWFATKNIPIVDTEKQPIIFFDREDALKMLKDLKTNL